jgi:hypothetical protein
MRTFLSSTFSSDTPAWTRGNIVLSLRTLILVVVLVGGAEVVARIALRPIGDYWQYWTSEAAPKFESYRTAVRRGAVPSVVIVGDSTGARDIDPARLGGNAYNLAWPANLPIAFGKCTLPLLQSSATPELVVASFTPLGFTDTANVRRLEESIVSSVYCRKLQGEGSVADFSALARVRLALPFRRSWWTGRSLPTVRSAGFMPKLGMGTEALLVNDDSAQFSDQRFEPIEALIRTARERGFALLVVVPPRQNPTAARLVTEQAYIDRLRRSGVAYLDYRDATFVKPSDFYDDAHLNIEGAEIFSKELAPRIERVRQESVKRGESGALSPSARTAATESN